MTVLYLSVPIMSNVYKLFSFTEVNGEAHDSSICSKIWLCWAHSCRRTFCRLEFFHSYHNPINTSEYCLCSYSSSIRSKILRLKFRAYTFVPLSVQYSHLDCVGCCGCLLAMAIISTTVIASLSYNVWNIDFQLWTLYL